MALAGVPAFAQRREEGRDEALAMGSATGMGAVRGGEIRAHRRLAAPETARDGADAQVVLAQRVDRPVARLPSRVALAALTLGARRRPIRRTRTRGARPTRRRGRVAEWHLPERRVVPEQEALEQRAEIRQQVPAIGHLYRRRCALPRPFGISTATVATDDLHPGMRREPRRQTRGGAVGEQVDRAVGRAIDEERPLGMPPAEAPGIHAQHAR